MNNPYKTILLILICFCFINLQAQISNDSTVSDIDGNVYKTVQIGTQVWMAENLRTTHYRNGDPILTTAPDTLDYSAEATPKYQFVYNNDVRNQKIYGRLYTWYTVTDSRNICPVGWHIPDIEEYKILDNALGGKNAAIGKLKATGKEYWKEPNSDATNESGFNGLPGGWHAAKGHYGALGKYGHWWCSNRQTEEYAFRMFLSFDESCYKNHLGSSDPQNAWSVRCVKDDTSKP
ncbi:MAG: fibrobacter succinogenes major paralogous domain-containing protein [Paludibacter sp.]|nr:fibrobacter succinogenes major paralogous domain-containing protein [Paludibacter sp.]